MQARFNDGTRTRVDDEEGTMSGRQVTASGINSPGVTRTRKFLLLADGRRQAET